MHQIPCIIGLNYIGKRRHGRPVHTGHEDPVEILIRRAALEAGVVARVGKVIRSNRLILAIGQGRSGWPVPASLLARGISSIPSSGKVPLRVQCSAR